MSDAPLAPVPGLARRVLHQPGAVLGGGLFAVIVLAVLIGPLLWPIAPEFIDVAARNQGPSLAHPFGTDQLGRDTFARVLWGGRISLAVGLSAMAVALLLGTLVGLLAGVFRWLDGPLMRLTDVFLALPLLPLLLVMVLLFRDSLSGVFGPEGGIFILIVLAIGGTSWMNTARIVRGDTLALREREFVLAARAAGCRPVALMLRHILPNVLSPILVSGALGLSTAIVTESALSFLGLGFPPDFPTWGRLLSDAVIYLADYPARAICPGLAISLTVLSVTYLGDGLRDAMDPRLH